MLPKNSCHQKSALWRRSNSGGRACGGRACAKLVPVTAGQVVFLISFLFCCICIGHKQVGAGQSFSMWTSISASLRAASILHRPQGQKLCQLRQSTASGSDFLISSVQLCRAKLCLFMVLWVPSETIDQSLSPLAGLGSAGTRDQGPSRLWGVCWICMLFSDKCFFKNERRIHLKSCKIPTIKTYQETSFQSKFEYCESVSCTICLERKQLLIFFSNKIEGMPSWWWWWLLYRHALNRYY